eukprot:13803053-Ditylum_brightwellii.AAC.1
MRELRKSGSSSVADYKQCSRDRTLHRFQQATQLPRPFSRAMHEVAAHIFPEKAGQAQKRYMQRNVRFGRGITVKEWVAQVLELNIYLKGFHAHNRNMIHPLDKDKLLDILKYRVPAFWSRKFTVQGFDPVDQGLQKCVELCTHLELCEPSVDKPKGKLPP